MGEKDMREHLPSCVAGCNMLYLPNIGYVLAINEWNPTPPTEDVIFPNLEFKFSINQVHYYKSSSAKGWWCCFASANDGRNNDDRFLFDYSHLWLVYSRIRRNCRRHHTEDSCSTKPYFTEVNTIHEKAHRNNLTHDSTLRRIGHVSICNYNRYNCC